MITKYFAERSLVKEIDDKIWHDLTIRTQLESFISIDADTEFFFEMLEDEFDEEFETYGGQTIQYDEIEEVFLKEGADKFIKFVMSKREMTKDQALTLILDVIKIYLINGKRFCN